MFSLTKCRDSNLQKQQMSFWSSDLFAQVVFYCVVSRCHYFSMLELPLARRGLLMMSVGGQIEMSEHCSHSIVKLVSCVELWFLGRMKYGSGAHRGRLRKLLSSTIEQKANKYSI